MSGADGHKGEVANSKKNYKHSLDVSKLVDEFMLQIVVV